MNLNERHLLRSAETVYEALEGAGLTTAAINITTYRGRHRHMSQIPGFPPVHGPKRFFFYSLYESDKTGAPTRLARRPRQRLDRRLRGDGRALARHARRLRPARLLPPGLRLRLARARARHRARGARPRGRGDHVAASTPPAGRTSSSSATRSLLCSDHGQTHVERVAQLVVDGARVTASNRAAMVYGDDPRALAAALDGEPSVDVALFLEDGEMVARRDGEEDLALLDEHPDGRARAEAALRNPNAGEVLVSAAPGWEFADLGGRHHAGGGSHGSLAAHRLRRADAQRRPGRAARLDHGDQGAHARALRGRRARGTLSRARLGRPPAPPPRHLGRARAGGDGARAARALRARAAARLRLRGRRAPAAARADRVAAVHGRRDDAGPRPRRRRARARRRHGLGLRGRGAGRARGRGALDRAHPGAGRGRARLAGRGGLRPRAGARRRRLARAARARAVRRHRRRGRRAARARGAVGAARAGRPHRAADRLAPAAGAERRRADAAGAEADPRGARPLRPARARAVSARPPRTRGRGRRPSAARARCRSAAP